MVEVPWGRDLMLVAERRRYILDELNRSGRVLSSELSSALRVSEDTIRRDLRELSEMGLLQRVHGGALPRSPAEVAFALRKSQSPAAKESIARAALDLVSDGQVLILDGGTTTLQLAYSLPSHLRATVLTNSPPVATALASLPDLDVILIGGELHKTGLVALGPAALETLGQFRADLCFLGVCSLHGEVGISVPDFREAPVKRAMIRASAEVAALASSEKLGTAAPCIVAPLSELTHLITDARSDDPRLESFRSAGVTVIHAV